MPRRSSGGRPAPRAAPRAPVHNPPQPAAPAPPPAPAQAKSATGGFGSAIMDGMAWGAGTSIAHRAVDAVMGPRVIQHESVAASAPAAAQVSTSTNLGGSDACGNQSKALQECLSNYGSDISKCQFYMDMLNECKRSAGSFMAA